VTRADLYGGIVLAIFFALALWEACTFQYGTEFSPGPGFAPVWLSGVGLVVSLLVAIYGFMAARGANASDEKSAVSLESSGLLRVILTLLGLAGMVIMVEALGLLLSLLLFLLYLTLIVQRHAWMIAVPASVGTVTFVYVVFVYFLEVPIPKGPLGL
jgi:hypothetical protein